MRQALGSMRYAFKCLIKYVPAVVIDTTGAPFANIVWKVLGGCKVVLYTHYPFISTDMFNDVKDRVSSVNNTESIVRSPFLTRVKLWYYRALGLAYGFVGSMCDVSMANSTWTGNHIEKLFGRKPDVVFPPCDVSVFSQFPLENREKLIISVGQFRPEKDQMLQLKAFKHLNTDYKLVIIGGCRNPGDEKIKDSLQAYIDEHHINAELKANIPYSELKSFYSRASIGLHTMRNEHFGICAVEYLASGLIPVCNKSAGPLLDIVQDERFLATTEDEYAEKLMYAMKQPVEQRQLFREKAQRFSQENFRKSFLDSVKQILPYVS